MQYQIAGLLNLAISLIIDTGFSWIRMFAALGISIVISIILGILLHSKNDQVKNHKKFSQILLRKNKMI